MNVATPPAAVDRGFSSEDERVAAQSIEQAATILTATRDDIPAGFVRALYARGAAEDLAGYEARDLARLAAGCFDHLKQRTPGAPSIRVVAPEAQGRLAAVSVVEIINDNMPFLVDSVMGELAEQGLDPRLVLHPIAAVDRDAHGALTAWRGDAAGGTRESVIHIHIDRLADPARVAALEAALAETLADVRLAVSDWPAMKARVEQLVAGLEANPPPLPVDEIAEAVQFLRWLAADNFTFLGVRDYALEGSFETGNLEPIFETGRGLLRRPEVRILRRGRELVTTTPEVREFLARPVPLIITKANIRSRVHRRVVMDYIGLKRFDAEGKLVGETRLVGLFTSSAYTRTTRSIPYLRRKVDRVMTRAGLDPESHSGKALANVLETYPRDELFQLDDDTAYRFASAILQLEERPRIRVLARRDKFDRFVSVLVYVPRERYDSIARVRIGEFLATTYQGRVTAFYPSFPEGHLARVHFIIGRYEGTTPDPDRRALEHGVQRIVRTWGDGLDEALTLAHEGLRAGVLAARWGEAFPVAYREAFPPAAAVGDIRMLEALSDDRPIGIDFYRPDPARRARAGLKVWSRGRPLPLSDRVPALENMGFRVVDERSYEIAATPGVWLHDMTIEAARGGLIDVEALEHRLEACFLAVLAGHAENDGFNALVLNAGLGWRDIALIRTLARFLRQIRVPFSQDYLWATLNAHPGLAGRIVDLFKTRFDPRLDVAMAERATREQAVAGEIEAALQDVSNLDEDRILRRFVEVVRAAVRTDFFQIGADGLAKTVIAIKFESRRIDGLPLPKPLYEIFVYSPRVEGVHLRFGKVARGGLRWSDRPQDFRTEVLGLVKAQQVKNAVIVPVGAKGGFVPKKLPPASDRAAWMAEGTEAYRIFVRTLLELTDNLDGDAIVPPPMVVRHDGDDPYLVVAADKGTATFSDTANALSAAKGHWLGDAFASGGSAGYDHKKMGITARGAWEAVKRHFREMDIDIQTTPFTVAGVGDMSGDVFGNGMLLSPAIRLVAAFDHRDIFLDPDPDPAVSLAERQRMFALPRSSWADYDRAKISAGGGVFARSAKAVPLSPPVQALLGLAKPEATPAEIMNAILKAPVDLLWFGGIGTYVRAADETDEQAGDRANDAIRVTGAELRAKVIGEGANLGMTQRGRIEAARRGVRLNTDAIDNSAGVNSSDVEVNIKIALATPVRDGRLDETSRNALLASMTPDVAALVLRNNYLQSLAISLSERRGAEDLGFCQRLMQTLEARGELDRAVEYLPDDAELTARAARGESLTRPELAVLLAYAKLTLYDRLLASEVPDDPYLARELVRYFPAAMREGYRDAIDGHRLRREIIATVLSNSMINRGGPSFVVRLADQTGADAAAIARAFAIVRDSYRMTDLNGELDTLDARMSGAGQLRLYAAVQDLMLSRTVWMLRNVALSGGLDELVGRFRAGVEALAAAVPQLLAPEQAAERLRRIEALKAEGLPDALATRMTDLPALAAAPDAVLVAERTGIDVVAGAATLFALGRTFGLAGLKSGAAGVAVADRFERLALDRAVDGLDLALRRLAVDLVPRFGAGDGGVAAWRTSEAAEIERARRFVAEIAAGSVSLAKLTLAQSLIGDLVRG